MQKKKFPPLFLYWILQGLVGVAMDGVGKISHSEPQLQKIRKKSGRPDFNQLVKN